MEFHISRAVRKDLDIHGLIFGYTGNVVFGDVAASRKLASQLNQARGPEADPVNAGALFAMGLIDELSHALVARYRKEIDPFLHAEAIRWFSSKVDAVSLEQLLIAFVEQFPNVAVYRGELTAQQWLNGTTDGMPNREAALEEMMLLWLANTNPAFTPFRNLFDDKDLKSQTVYKNVTAGLPDYLTTRPPLAPEAGSLYDALRAPMLASPGSITGQLEFIRTHWSKYLAQDLRRLLLAIDVLREEDLAIWLRFHPPGPDWHRHGAPTWGSQGFRGDEFIGYEDDFGKRRYAHDYQAPLHEYEAFSADQAWMPNVVLVAKSTYVWLEQLSKKYGRHIHRLNQIPDEELRLLADRGITGLWLIGLWERSIASRTIKRLRGQSDAVASAYSLKEYDIAEDLGGYSAYEDLRNRAARVGIRLASDMVPNHMGIDSEWVTDHPDWFIYRWESPFPAYSFNGPDLSPDSRVEIKIEDHYYDQTDAAVAFRLRHHHDGTTRYIYHGNDGTSFAWNDTAQLDYSKAEVREQVIQTILHVARQFPIIRFDAAMVLAKRHVQRLWFPLPGAGGSIPSRAENSMSQEEFDALMPHEFWREVVDRVAAEVPGTLLLAEAFWLLEAYFVRTLGMHRVYNSAFMNMLRDEENAKYRSYLKKTIEFDTDVLKRYVNFMSNPDERTAIDQFGTGDKYFGVCTLLATLPGLPMFGHGQIEGFTERYGMEFKRARMDEHPKDWLIARHQQEIAPLLKNRKLFAESHNFVLYDFWNTHGTVDENVFAYSNRLGDQRGLIVYNNTYGSTRGTIHISAAFMDKGSGQQRQRSLADGLGVAYDDSLIFAYRDTARGLEYLRRATDMHHHGLNFDLRGFQYVVLINWRELRSTVDQPWDRLCDALHGDGVYSVDEALTRLRLHPVHDALHQVINAGNACAFAELSGRETRKYLEKIRKERPVAAAFDKLTASVINLPNGQAAHDPRLRAFLEKAQNFFERAVEVMPAEDREALTIQASDNKDGDTADLNQSFHTTCEEWAKAAIHLPLLEQTFSTAWPASVRDMLPSNEPGISVEQTWAPVLAWIILRSFSPRGMSIELFDKLMMRAALAETFSSLGMEGERAWQAAARVRSLVAHADLPSESLIQLETFWADPDVRWLTGVNESSGKTYFNKEQFEELLSWTQLPALLAIAQQDAIKPAAVEEIESDITRSCLAATKAGYQLDTYLSLLTTEKALQK
ncbi:alpha-amylase [Alloacidobacterium dinghuense]|uniref:Alpha-amylase n=1 Tax=Alloacidobacterium dinghuense TaxID=2763107 RepID=A0A7G8BP03_9BACT|nr:alpha-amylase family glycosyl hydrolase [Alloacidobacterium dinghuense]QNI34273.1 alpha-amylase [Alloacidobacterium dinghuense]